MNRFEFAREFGRFGHNSILQVRKVTGLAYWTHTEAVTEIVRSVTDKQSMLIAALLHDIVEDVYPKNSAYSLQTIKGMFGWEVSELVDQLTDKFTKEAYPYLNRDERHALERKRQALMDWNAKVIKIADLIHNTSDIVETDPDFAITYLKEKSLLLPLLRVTNDLRNVKLFNIANNQLEKYCKELDVRL